MIINNKHYFRINNYNEGYTLFVSDKNYQFEKENLDISGNNVTSNYIYVQKRIDEFLSNNDVFLTLSFRYDKNNLIVAYGCTLNNPDEKGRIGITYTHAIEFSDCKLLYSCVFSIIQFLSLQSLNEHLKLVAGVAIGKQNVLNVIKTIAHKIDNNIIYTKTTGKTNEIHKAIKHDCTGASSISWLTFANYFSNYDDTFEVFDRIEQNSIFTFQISNIISNQITNASFIFSNLLHQKSTNNSVLNNNETFITSQDKKKQNKIKDNQIKNSNKIAKINQNDSQFNTPENQTIIKEATSEKNVSKTTDQHESDKNNNLNKRFNLIYNEYSKYIILILIVWLLTIYIRLGKVDILNDRFNVLMKEYVSLSKQIYNFKDENSKLKQKIVDLEKVINVSTPKESGIEQTNSKPFSKIYHTVKTGETVHSIANLYGVSIEEIRQLNPNDVKNNYSTTVGKTLFIKKYDK